MPVNYFGYEPLIETQTRFNPSDKQLNQLAEFMTRPLPKRIPAGYTYLGQFIDHDISLDSANREFPWHPIAVASTYNRRTPFLNLETIYGFVDPLNEDEPPRAKLMQPGSKTLLQLGNTVPGNSVQQPFAGKDLPRVPGKSKALIVDLRNDENLAVAQTQLLFMRFHNAVVRHLGGADTEQKFEEVCEIVIRHYQWIILHDYLPRMVKKSVLNEVLNEGTRFYFPNAKYPFVPLEFSVAAFRAAHSMIRNSYNWNYIFNDDQAPSVATLRELSQFTGRGGLGNRRNLISDWAINWYLFYEITGVSQGLKFNFADEINTNLAPLLGVLPDHTTGNPPRGFNRATSLSAMDLYRARALGLPSGQAVAKMILGTEDLVLRPEQIGDLLPASLKYAFSKETPLWFYLLAEAELEERGLRLGKVGSRIVAETLVKLIRLSTPSVFSGNFQPRPDFFVGEKEFGMRELLRFVAQSEKQIDNQIFDHLNPLKNI